MNLLSKRILVAAIAGTTCLAQPAGAFALPAATLPGGGPDIVQARGGFHGGGFHGGGFHGGYHGGAAVVRPGHGAAVVRPGYGGYHGGYRPGYGGYRPGYHGGWHGGPVYVGGWRRPGYGWAPGGAIAAGAAIGVLSAAAAAAYASQPAPANGLCWYYTDPSYTAGFWDVCR
jgi:hypothetical protein